MFVGFTFYIHLFSSSSSSSFCVCVCVCLLLSDLLSLLGVACLYMSMFCMFMCVAHVLVCCVCPCLLCSFLLCMSLFDMEVLVSFRNTYSEQQQQKPKVVSHVYLDHLRLYHITNIKLENLRSQTDRLTQLATKLSEWCGVDVVCVSAVAILNTGTTAVQNRTSTFTGLHSRKVVFTRRI